MDIKKLQLLADVAETLNFTKTGERTGYTQSGVSHILKALETELGIPLFSRTKKGVCLTSYATELLPYIRELLRTNERLEQMVSSLTGMTSGHLSIGSFASVSIHLLPPIIRHFAALYPDISIQLKEGGSKNVEEWITQGVVDIGFFSRRPSSALEWIPLVKDPLVAILPPGFSRSQESFPLSGFQEHPYIMPENGYDYDVEDAFLHAGILPKIRYTSMNDHAIISMVSNHLGISLMPRLMVKGYENDIQILPIDPPCYRELGIGMLSKEHLTPAAKEFIHYATTLITQHSYLEDSTFLGNEQSTTS